MTATDTLQHLIYEKIQQFSTLKKAEKSRSSVRRITQSKNSVGIICT
ncbi:hypothetical protein LCACRF28_1534 [Lacticaseibacillus paracasei]|nr:hypothetical protein LCACRF28_1534 [Lacticaseibacillus paracasei]